MDLQVKENANSDGGGGEQTTLDVSSETGSPQLPFHNSDIFNEICEYLAYEDHLNTDDVPPNRKTLLQVAMTCKAFLEPALDRLWRTLGSLFPLLNILPAFAPCDGTYVLRGPISDADWVRFDWYARRIRKFCYTRDPESLDIAMHVYFRLAQLRSTPILPSLRHLQCPAVSQIDFLISGICLFLSPSLQALEFDQISSVEDKLCGTVLHTLSSDGANMEKIILRGRGLSRDTICLAIKFQYLRELKLVGMGEALNMPIIETIGALPWLVDLVIDFTDSTILPLEKDIGLKDLKSLKIIARGPFIQSFLARITTQTLETFKAVTPSSPVTDKKELLEDVVSRWKDTLRRVALMQQQVDDTSEALHIAALAPLIPLRKLTYLRLEGYAMELTNDDIANFATAWPDMTTLLLPFIGTGHPRPTLQSLLTLSRLSPKLRHLRMPINTTDMRPFTLREPNPLAHGLQKMSIMNADDPWEFRDVLHLARHLDYLFPRLRTLYPFDDHDVDRWLQVHDAIQMYQTVRQEATSHERARQKCLAMT